MPRSVDLEIKLVVSVIIVAVLVLVTCGSCGIDLLNEMSTPH